MIYYLLLFVLLRSHLNDRIHAELVQTNHLQILKSNRSIVDPYKIFYIFYIYLIYF